MGLTESGTLRDRQWAFREEEIVRTTVGLLATEGCRGMTMDDVASRLGISKATLYSHFRSKGELIGRVLHHSADEALADIRELAPTGGPDESRLREVSRYLLERLLRGGSDAEPVTWCCLTELACPYDGWDRVEALLAENGAPVDASVPFGDALRALAALVEHRRRNEGRAPTTEDVDAILQHLFPDR